MKIGLLALFILSTFYVDAQCWLLDRIDSVKHFEGVKIQYYQADSNVQIKYWYNGFKNDLGSDYATSCKMRYGPGKPSPAWRNESFICFRTGCGTYCFSDYLAPLKPNLEAQYGGDILIDTLLTISLTFVKDTNYNWHIKLKNHVSGEEQIQYLPEGTFPVAVPLGYLDHQKPFTYSNNLLTLYTRKNEMIEVKVEI
jgi:hypothetical protein